VTCHVCQQPIDVIVDSLYGRRSYRCGCGILSRRDAPPPEPPGRKGNGFMSKGVFYGTCLNPACRQEFEASYPRQSCDRPACLDWLRLGRHGKPVHRPARHPYPQTERPCRVCGEPFVAWKATVCPKLACQNARKRDYSPPKSPESAECRYCGAPFVRRIGGRPQEYCLPAHRKAHFKQRKAS